MLSQPSRLLASTCIPKAANQAKEISKSTVRMSAKSRRTECIRFHDIHGHVKNPDEKGISHTRPNNIDIAAITSV